MWDMSPSTFITCIYILAGIVAMMFVIAICSIIWSNPIVKFLLRTTRAAIARATHKRRVSKNVQRAFSDFSQMSGIEFEHYIKELLENEGWDVETTPLTRDGGIDLIASRMVVLGGRATLYIQCKNYGSPIGVGVVRELNGVLPEKSGCHGIVICPSGFSPDARSFAKDKGIILWERKHLLDSNAWNQQMRLPAPKNQNHLE